MTMTEKLADALRLALKHIDWSDVHATKGGGFGVLAYGRTEYHDVRDARAVLAEYDKTDAPPRVGDILTLLELQSHDLALSVDSIDIAATIDDIPADALLAAYIKPEDVTGVLTSITQVWLTESSRPYDMAASYTCVLS